MRIAVIGAGSIGCRHLRNLRHLRPQAELLVVRGRRQPDEGLVKTLGVAVMDSLDAAMESGPDAVVVASPTAFHAETIASLMAAGMPFYAEKPVGASLADLRALERALADTDSPPTTLVGCNLRFLPALRRFKSALDEGIIGRVARASLTAGQWLPDWRPKVDYRESYSAVKALGGGVILDLIHEIDIARWLFGDFHRVAGMAGRFSSLALETEDVACALLSPSSGSGPVSLNLDYVSRRPVRVYEVVGDEGTLRFDLQAQRLERIDADGSTTIPVDDGGFDVAKTYLSAMEEFLSCLASGTTTSQPIEEGVESLRLALSIKESAGL